MNDPIRAVHDDDLPEFLKRLGVLGDIQARRATCFLCGSPVLMETFHAAVPDSGSVKLVCSRPVCVGRLAAWLAERRK
jgi:hypothetical protein